MLDTILSWVGFNIFILLLLTLDLVVFNRRPHEVKVKESLVWSMVWIGISLMFNVGVYFWKGHDAALQFLTGYLIEKSLSVDNLFVFLLIFSYFKVPAAYQHKVLFWGILGALVMRGTLIVTGTALIQQFHWILYIFGLFLVVTGARMALSGNSEKEIHPERNIIVRFFKAIFRVSPNYHGEKFFVKAEGKHFATLLLIVVIVIETTDLVFAVDSIPAVFAITTDSFIVYTSNVFAILGLRSLYFALAGIMDLFYYLRHGLSVVLVFVGAKMLVDMIYHMPIGIALAVVAGVLCISIIASVRRAKKGKSNSQPAKS